MAFLVIDMKKLLLANFIFLNFFLAQAQTTTQKGNVRLQNSGKKPVSGVQILFTGAKATESDVAGSFRLVFAGKKPGDLVFLERIQKQGFELVNEKELQQIKLSNSGQMSVDIILAVAGSLEAAKKEYYQVSDNALLAGFNREKQNLRDKLKQAKFTQQEYIQKYNELEKQYENQKKNLDALAERFARTNFDDVSELYKDALELFKTGRIDESLKKLEGANLMNEAEKILTEEKKIESLQKEIADQEKLAQEQKEQTIQALLLDAELQTNIKETTKVRAIVEKLLVLDSTNIKVLQKSAAFYRKNQEYSRAIKFYTQIITHLQAEDTQKANAYSGLVLTYTLDNQWDKAQELYKKWELIKFTNDLRLAKDILTQDIYSLEKNGVSHPDFKKIKQIAKKTRK
jgi:hypothetical protein